MSVMTTQMIVLQTQYASTHEDHLSVNVREGIPRVMTTALVRKSLVVMIFIKDNNIE